MILSSDVTQRTENMTTIREFIAHYIGGLPVNFDLFGSFH